MLKIRTFYGLKIKYNLNAKLTFNVLFKSLMSKLMPYNTGDMVKYTGNNIWQ